MTTKHDTSKSVGAITIPLIVQLLRQRATLSPLDVERLQAIQAKDNTPLEHVIVESGLASEHEIAAMYSQHLLLPLFQLPNGDVGELDNALADLLPEKLCRDLLIAPVGIGVGTLDIAFATPSELLAIDELQFRTGLTVAPYITRISDIERIIGHYYGGGEFSASDLNASVQSVDDSEDDSADKSEGDSEVVHLDQPAPPGRDGRVVRLVNQILSQALHERASDIHMEPFEDSCAVRFRIDGKLNSIAQPPRSLFVPIVSRLKVLAKLDIAEKRLPQDGAIALRSTDRRVDLRVSTVPTVHGEKLVLRVLDKGAIPHDLEQLGLDQRQASDMLKTLAMPHGLILVTGPTGSGKSTTLYSCLQRLNSPDHNICTVEDPVEYKFHGINQVQTKSQIGLTFAGALRSFLRQDPDIIMVGEVRDQETADISMRAALTGHLVLSTLHTNDALSAVARLKDMGIEPFLLGSTLRLLEAQRLLRKLCSHCKERYSCDTQTSKRFKLEVGETLYRAAGCDNCRGTGYAGRIGIFEVIAINRELERLIQTDADSADLARQAKENGVQSLLDSALKKVRQGETSLEVALSVGHSTD